MSDVLFILSLLYCWPLSGLASVLVCVSGNQKINPAYRRVNIPTCADNSNDDKKNNAGVTCHMSHVTNANSYGPSPCYLPHYAQ